MIVEITVYSFIIEEKIFVNHLCKNIYGKIPLGINCNGPEDEV